MTIDRPIYGHSVKNQKRLDATSIAFSVGYESPNQFSREYARLFGLPPFRDLVKAALELRVT